MACKWKRKSEKVEEIPKACLHGRKNDISYNFLNFKNVCQNSKSNSRPDWSLCKNLVKDMRFVKLSDKILTVCESQPSIFRWKKELQKGVYHIP